MRLEEIHKLLNDTGIPATYHHWERTPACPFIVYYAENSDNFPADNIPYYEQDVWAVELYTHQREPETEKLLEDALRSAGLFYDKSYDYVNELRSFQITYEIEV